MNAKKNNIIRRFELTIAALICSTGLLACGTEAQEYEAAAINSNYGIQATAIEAEEYVDISEVAVRPELDVPQIRIGENADEGVDLTGLAQALEARRTPVHLELHEEIDAEKMAEIHEEGSRLNGPAAPRAAFESGCGTSKDWINLIQEQCERDDASVSEADVHGECAEGFTSSKFACVRPSEKGELESQFYEAMVIGDATSCKSETRLKEEALLFCGSRDIVFGAPSQGCENAAQSEEDMFQVYVFICRR